MPVAVDTKSISRARPRQGRRVKYTPTSAEVTSFGAGPYQAEIIKVRSNGLVDLQITWPSGSAPQVTSPDGSDAGTTQTLANEIKADYNNARTFINNIKQSVRLGSLPGRYSY